MTTATCCHRDDVAALALGVILSCLGTLALIGGSGVVFWIAGMH